MTDITDNEDEIVARRKKTDGEGETAGAGNAISKMLTTKKAQQVEGERRHLIGNDLIEALIEFADGIMRASAQVKTVWNKTFTLVTDYVMFLKNELPALAKNMVRGVARDSRAPPKLKTPGNNLGMNYGPTGPNE